MQIDNIPKKISYLWYLEVRGEVVMPLSSFNSLNEQAKIEWTKIFSNPRNAASWSLRMKDNSVTKKRKLKYFAYDLANFEEFTIKENINEYYRVINDLESIGFDISSYFIKCKWIDEVVSKIENFWDVKDNIDFEIDGLVIKVNNIELWKQIWSTEHHPKYAIAYKFPAEILTTKIISVEHSIWRTWTITPVANLEPINIWWAMISRATIHNYDEVEKLDIRVGDNIFIKRAWEVIPKIISVIKDVRTWEEKVILPPKVCPSCLSDVFKDDDKVRYYCSNKVDCPAGHSEKLTFAVGKQWFNIDGFWEKQVETFLKEWIIYNLVDIFNIKEKKEQILDLEWFQEKSVNNLIESVEKSKNVDISILLTALWIAWVWKKTSKIIKKLFKSSDDIVNFTYSLEELELLPDIWPEIAKNLVEYFSDKTHREILVKLISILDISYYKEVEIDNSLPFSGKKMCITWSFDNYKREELAEILEKNGWDFVSSVSKKTDFLLAWEKAWSKLKKANELWVKVLSVEEFLELTK